MNTIKYLNEHGLQSLQDELAIKVNQWKDLYVLNYNQIDSPKNHQVTNECRSLVVKEGESGWEVVSRGFDRFFNHGEIDGFEYDITKMIAYEKVDGSLVCLFYYNGEWLYRTRSMIMPETTVNGWDTTWKDLIEPVLLGKGFHEFNHCPSWTYIFEVVGVENRVVTRYNESAAYLLAVRDNQVGDYINMGMLYPEQRGWRLPNKYEFNTINNCLQAAKDLKDLNEGYVLYDNFGVPRIKVKNPAYVAAHLLRGEGLNPKRIMQLIFMNETAEYLAIFPEDKVHFEPYLEVYSQLEYEIIGCYKVTKSMTDQKTFALAIKNHCYSGVLFSARKQNKNPIEVLHSMDESYKIKLLTQYMGEK